MQSELHQKEYSRDFYDNRHKKGYMREWPNDKKQRVIDVIKSYNLPETGTALDFGCGSGVFTNVVKQALPKWKVYGCDISANAVNNAKARFTDCDFFVSDPDNLSEIKFDFIFSHHVLEHVFDIEKTIYQISNYLKPQASVCFVIPCGNEGSLEYKVCKMRADGINENMEGLFFFESEGHIRRLTTEQTTKLMHKYKFELQKEFYANQYYGALQWISQSPMDFILKFTDTEKAINEEAKKYLSSLRFKLKLLHNLQAPMRRYVLFKNCHTIGDYFRWLIRFIPSVFSYFIIKMVNNNANKEWLSSRHLQNGSEMFLYYKRK